MPKLYSKFRCLHTPNPPELHSLSVTFASPYTMWMYLALALVQLNTVTVFRSAVTMINSDSSYGMFKLGPTN